MNAPSRAALSASIAAMAKKLPAVAPAAVVLAAMTDAEYHRVLRRAGLIALDEPPQDDAEEPDNPDFVILRTAILRAADDACNHIEVNPDGKECPEANPLPATEEERRLYDPRDGSWCPRCIAVQACRVIATLRGEIREPKPVISRVGGRVTVARLR